MLKEVKNKFLLNLGTIFGIVSQENSNLKLVELGNIVNLGLLKPNIKNETENFINYTCTRFFVFNNF